MIQFLTYLYLILPKIDLIQFSFSPTGIRLQDFIILIMTLLLPKKLIKQLIAIVILISLLAIPSIFVGFIYYETAASVVGHIRLIEYMSLAFCLLYLLNTNKLPTVLFYCLFLHLVVGLMQFFHILPLIDPGRGIFYSPQFAGLMGTPSELTYFFIVVLPILYSQYNRIILPVKFFLVLNQVKGGLLSFIVNIKLRYLLILLIFLLIIDYFSFSIAIELYNFFNFMFQIKLQDVPLNHIKGAEWGSDYYGEASLAQRVYKWWNTIGFLVNNYPALIFGVGYGAFPGAMDGGLVKLLLELGAVYFTIILLLFLLLGYKVFIVFFATNFLFDGYTSSVVAPFLLMYLIMPNKKYLK